MTNNIATIPSKITKGEELVVIPRSLYEKFLVWQEEVKDALAKVKRGRKNYQEGKTYVADSPRDLLSK
jgi:hypothetical protein